MRTANQHEVGKGTKQSSGSIFQYDSFACHAALEDLSVVLKQVGFVVDKKRDSESTLRVYVRERLTYPLLNPRFRRQSVPGVAGRAILEITALSKGDEELERRLSSFPSSAQVVFKSAPSQEGNYVTHGYFAVPLVFRGAGRQRALDVAALGPALTVILRYLE